MPEICRARAPLRLERSALRGWGRRRTGVALLRRRISAPRERRLELLEQLVDRREAPRRILREGSLEERVDLERQVRRDEGRRARRRVHDVREHLRGVPGERALTG
ncbi:MAG: hypothetical protein U0271_30110 [Polyangiaceae bacterium]